ncbi:hypothetical protein BC834DRAFT_595748 [Gloeopeniophorella convolvens]|nr:hypothetical protein BC834DRAFT_595748 [Gloeopeniophorella convolvens]
MECSAYRFRKRALSCSQFWMGPAHTVLLPWSESQSLWAGKTDRLKSHAGPTEVSLVAAHQQRSWARGGGVGHVPRRAPISRHDPVRQVPDPIPGVRRGRTGMKAVHTHGTGQRAGTAVARALYGWAHLEEIAKRGREGARRRAEVSLFVRVIMPSPREAWDQLNLIRPEILRRVQRSGERALFFTMVWPSM